MAEATKRISAEVLRSSSAEEEREIAPDDWFSEPLPPRRLTKEEAEAFEEYLRKPHRPTPALRALFAKKW
jgi:hypothetical protein